MGDWVAAHPISSLRPDVRVQRRCAGEGVGPSPTYVNEQHLKHKEV